MNPAATQTPSTPAAATPPAGAAPASAAAPAAPAAAAAAPGAAPAAAAAGGAGAPAAAPAAAAQPAPPAAPVAADVKFPEGFTPDEKLAGKFKAMIGESKIDGPIAQKFAEFWAESEKATHQAAVQRAEQTFAQWQETAKTDKELSAPGFRDAAKQGMLKFATPELAKLFDATGLGEHPEFIRVFGRLGKLSAEDRISGTTGAQPQASAEEAFLRQMYDHPSSASMFKKE